MNIFNFFKKKQPIKTKHLSDFGKNFAAYAEPEFQRMKKEDAEVGLYFTERRNGALEITAKALCSDALRFALIDKMFEQMDEKSRLMILDDLNGKYNAILTSTNIPFDMGEFFSSLKGNQSSDETPKPF